VKVRNGPPCRECKERYDLCHSKRLYYKNWKEEHQKKKESIFGERQKETMITGFTVDSICRTRRSNGKRGGKKKLV